MSASGRKEGLWAAMGFLARKLGRKKRTACREFDEARRGEGAGDHLLRAADEASERGTVALCVMDLRKQVDELKARVGALEAAADEIPNRYVPEPP